MQLCTVLSLKLGLLTKQGFTLQVVVDIDGDGSFLMNCQELATAFIEKLDVKCFILNNQHLGMVVQWEDRFYKQNRAQTHASPAYLYFITCLCKLQNASRLLTRLIAHVSCTHADLHTDGSHS